MDKPSLEDNICALIDKRISYHVKHGSLFDGIIKDHIEINNLKQDDKRIERNIATGFIISGIIVLIITGWFARYLL